MRLVHKSLSICVFFLQLLHLFLALFPSAGVLAEAAGSQAACECSASGDPALFTPQSLFFFCFSFIDTYTISQKERRSERGTA